MKTAAAYLTALLVAMFFALFVPQVADAARYEELSVTKLTLNETVITNTPARLNAATPAGTAAAFPSVAASGGITTAVLNATGDVTLGDVTGTDRISVFGYLSYIQNAQTLTNAQVIGASYPLIVVTTAVASNNVTLPQATFAGQYLTIMGATTLTNTLVILDTATQAGDITIGASDTITYIANSASNFTEICRSNN